MNKFMMVLFVSLFIFSCNHKQEKHPALIADAENGGLTLPEGFSALVVSEGVGRGRHITVNTNGDIYVSLSQQAENKGIACLRDTDSDGKADLVEYTGEHLGTGIKLHKGYLYFGADSAIVRYPMTEG